MEKKMCSQCKNPKGKCKIRYIVLMHTGTSNSLKTEPVGTKIGLEKTIQALVAFIEGSKRLDSYHVDVENIKGLTEGKRISEKFDDGEITDLHDRVASWIWFEIVRDKQFHQWN